MAATIRKPDQKFSANLDRFGMNKIFCMPLIYKTVKTSNQTQSLDFKWSDIRMIDTGIRFNPNTASGSVFGCILYLTMPRFEPRSLGWTTDALAKLSLIIYINVCIYFCVVEEKCKYTFSNRLYSFVQLFHIKIITS
jgi:hypothetical protein